MCTVPRRLSTRPGIKQIKTRDCGRTIAKFTLVRVVTGCAIEGHKKCSPAAWTDRAAKWFDRTGEFSVCSGSTPGLNPALLRPVIRHRLRQLIFLSCLRTLTCYDLRQRRSAGCLRGAVPGLGSHPVSRFNLRQRALYAHRHGTPAPGLTAAANDDRS